MVYNTGNGASLRNYQIKHKFQRKDNEYYIIVRNQEKREKNTKYFSETTQTTRVDQPEPSLQSEQVGLEQQRKCL